MEPLKQSLDSRGSCLKLKFPSAKNFFFLTLVFLASPYYSHAGIRVYYPDVEDCRGLYRAIQMQTTTVGHAVRDLTKKDFTEEVVDSESFVYAHYRELAQSGKYELFNERAYQEFIAEDRLLPRDRTYYLESRNPATGEVEGVMRVFLGFEKSHNWRFWEGSKTYKRLIANSDSKLPMQYHHLKVANDFFQPMKIELGRLVTKEGTNRVRVATELIHAAFDTIFVGMISRTGPIGGAPPWEIPVLYVHSDAVRARAYRRLGFKEVDVNRQQTGLKDGEFILSASIEEIYNRILGGIDKSKKLYDLDVAAGDLQGAIAAMQEAIKIYPLPRSFSTGHRRLAELFCDNGDLPSALHHAQLALKAQPASAENLAVYLKALRLSAGFAFPLAAKTSDLAAKQKDWERIYHDLEKSLENEQHLQKLPPQGFIKTILAPKEALLYQMFIMKFFSGELDAALTLRRQIAGKEAEGYEFISWINGTIYSPNKIMFFRRPGFRVTHEKEVGLEYEDLRVESANALSDYFYLQQLTTRLPGIAMSRYYHEISGKLLLLAGMSAEGARHLDFAKRLLKEDIKIKNSST